MLRIEVRFPLGVYHALSTESFGSAEWPPSPVRLVGALLAAAHESDAVDTDAGRQVLRQICATVPPELIAPPIGSPLDSDAPEAGAVTQLRGASRWAPRNKEGPELKKKGISFRNIAGDQTEVFKGGTVIGDRPVEIRWPELELDPEQLDVLRLMTEEVTFLGTSRSPAVVTVSTDPPEGEEDSSVWKPTSGFGFDGTEVRVPTPDLLDSFDRRHDARRSTGKKPVQSSGHVPNAALGSTLPYLTADRIDSLFTEGVQEQTHWGDMLILELDMGANGGKSELWPGASASYLVARAFRSALLNVYGPVGTPDEAPSVLRGHGAEPHVAMVPLPHVGVVAARTSEGPDGEIRREPIAADGLIRGIAVVLPHESRVPDVLEQRLRVEDGLRRFVMGEDRESIRVPGAGRLWLKLLPPDRNPLKTLQEPVYTEPSHVWETVTPVIHARRRTSTGPRGIARQIAADCEFAGLPEPIQIEVLKNAPLAGAPDMPLSPRAVPPAWRSSMTGPHSHLRLTFAQRVEGPVLLGRASHFGLGLCRPVPERRQSGSSPEAPAERVAA